MTFSALTTPLAVGNDQECGGARCGNCPECRRKAAVSVAAYVLKVLVTDRGRSYENSGPDERRYIHATIARMLDAAGLGTQVTKDPERARRSEWGWAMRQRQLKDQ